MIISGNDQERVNNNVLKQYQRNILPTMQLEKEN